jgi:hypothetical protein
VGIATGSDYDGAFYVSVDWAGIDDLEDLGEDLPTDGSPIEWTPGGALIERDADALITVPLFSGTAGMFAAVLMLGLYGAPPACSRKGSTALWPTPRSMAPPLRRLATTKRRSSVASRRYW